MTTLEELLNQLENSVDNLNEEALRAATISLVQLAKVNPAATATEAARASVQGYLKHTWLKYTDADMESFTTVAAALIPMMAKSVVDGTLKELRSRFDPVTEADVLKRLAL